MSTQKLEQAVVLAVQAVHSTTKEKLAAAPNAQREALEALMDQIEQHDCKDQRFMYVLSGMVSFFVNILGCSGSPATPLVSIPSPNGTVEAARTGSNLAEACCFQRRIRIAYRARLQ